MTDGTNEPDRRGEAPSPTKVKPNQFLPKSTYRMRRLEDGLKLWPLLGVVLFFVPVLWTRGVQSNVSAMVFLFVLWGLLLIGAAALSRAYSDAHPQNDTDSEAETGRDA